MILVLGLLLGVAYSAQWRMAGLPEDEGLLLEYPELILHGQLPFRDFQSSYGPGSYLPLAATYALTGPSVTAERAVGFVYRFALIVALVLLLFPLGLPYARAGGALALFVSVVAPPPLIALGWVFALACGLWSIWVARTALTQTSTRRRHLLWGLSGALVGAAISARFDIGLALLFASAILLFRAKAAARWSFAGGLALGVVPLAFDIAAAGWAHFWTFAVSARLHELAAGEYPFPHGLDYLVILTLATLVAAIAAIRAYRSSGATPVGLSLLAVALIAVLILPQALQRPDAAHFAYTAPVAFALLPLVAWANRPVWINRLFDVATALIVLVTISSWAAGQGTVLSHDGRSFPFSTYGKPRELGAVLRWMDIHVPSGRRLFVGPSDLRWALEADTAVYYLEPRLPHAGFYLELGGGDDTQQFTKRLLTDLNRADVLELEVVSRGARASSWPEARRGSDMPNLVVRQEFVPAFRVGPYSVWLRRSKSKASSSKGTPITA